MGNTDDELPDPIQEWLDSHYIAVDTLEEVTSPESGQKWEGVARYIGGESILRDGGYRLTGIAPNNGKSVAFFIKEA